MAVLLTVAKTLNGAAVSDVLAGAGAGIDLGSCVNGQFVPIISQPSNTGWQDIFIRHDALVNSITDVKTFISPFSQTYGGAGASAAADFTTMKSKGDSSSNASNNDGAGAGLRVEHDADIGSTLGMSAFDGTRAQVDIYKTGVGDSLANGVPLHVDACVYDNAGSEADASTPVTGKIGKAADTVLGDRAHLKLRYYLETAAASGGIIQWDFVMAYSYTA